MRIIRKSDGDWLYLSASRKWQKLHGARERRVKAAAGWLYTNDLCMTLVRYSTVDELRLQLGCWACLQPGLQHAAAAFCPRLSPIDC